MKLIILIRNNNFVTFITFHWQSCWWCQKISIRKQTSSQFVTIFNIYIYYVWHVFNNLSIPNVMVCFQPGMFSPGSHAPPPYPGQGQPSHLQPSTPMFVAPPPKTQRVLHSEAYLKYIEGLNAESSTVSKWDETLKGGVPWLVFFFFLFTADWHRNFILYGLLLDVWILFI